ncbi:PRC-barrel domain-containing protein [Diaphorobacter aerolatus]|uniref:PRC-barrel domain-containing protein n=1 Tax=Diaphorobacter aerolatus TaxID=1288495 RepID=A0A7H0GHP2_9BURK|nr:PRC-barrel domain-containing protein [Diaphorobacter aerolatus]QNP47808.1 PRC-barrel domain-containing protein [Diaphorobacter aerolatus]
MDTENTSGTIISSEKVRGTNVYSPAGEKLGSVEALMIDKISGRVRYAVMEFGGFLGMGTDVYPLPWDALKYSTEEGGYMVSLTKEQLDGAPRYNRDDSPEYSDEYGRKVYDYYNVPWL